MRPINKKMIRAALCLGILLSVQSAGFPQPVTGTLVNTILLLTAMAVSPYWAVAIGFISPLLGIVRGVVPAAMMPALAFIGLGNMVYLVVFLLTERTGFPRIQVPAVILGASAKYALLWMAANLVLELPGPARAMLGLPQLGTALAGGLLAVLMQQPLSRAGVVSAGIRQPGVKRSTMREEMNSVTGY